MRRIPYLLLSIALSLIGILELLTTVKQARASITPPPLTLTQVMSVKIHPTLLRWIKENSSKEMPRVIIEWKRSNTLYQKSPSLSPQSKNAQREAWVTTLQSDMETQTAGLMKVLEQAEHTGKAKDIQRFWISPIIALDASPELIQTLAQRDEVAFIRPDEKIQLQVEPISQTTPTQSDPSSWLYNLDLIEADKVKELFGYTGKGVVVANIDTGVDYYHPALIKKYRGYNSNGIPYHLGNWFVVTGEPYLYPGDGYGHGTHTMGTILGEDDSGYQIGVAPGAKWIAVKAFTNQGFTYESWLHAAFQWVIAPNGDPSLAPDIVNNSWGSDNGYDKRFQDDVKALRAAGIFTVFSAGNNGPSMGTIGSPASYPEAFSVGAVDSVKLPATFSSRGPSPWDEIKPEISAPGVNILSSFPGGGYAKMDGTSMAAPQVAGVAALLLQANPSLTLDQLEQILIQSAEPIGSAVPNNDTGYGLVNAYTSILQVTQNGILTGYVTDSNLDQPILYPSITITTRDPLTPTKITILGDQTGFYQVALLPGVYDVLFSAFGYESKFVSSQTILNNETTKLNVSLARTPVATLSGSVLDAINFTPLSAAIQIENAYVKVQTNPVNGNYQLALPSGVYTLTIRSDGHRILHQQKEVQAGQSYAQDFYLTQAPRILLVDSGAWYYRSEIGYYEQALQSLDYPYHEWAIHNPFGSTDFPDDRPTTSTLSAYDLVIWSAPLDSPGTLDLGSVISIYLSGGGNLLLSGEDIAYNDGGGSYYSSPQPYFEKLLGIDYQDEMDPQPLFGEPKTPFEGSSVELNPPDSAKNQKAPDTIFVLNKALAQPILRWQDNKIGGIIAEACVPYKVLWLGFGLEGSGPLSTRLDILNRALNWFTAPKPAYSFISNVNQNIKVSPPDSIITATFTIYNNGTQPDRYNLDFQTSNWFASILLPDGNSFTDHTDLSISACQSQTLTATLQIPSDALRAQSSDYSLDVSSQNDSSLTTTLTTTAKTPSPILLVDDQLFYDHLMEYTTSIQNGNNFFDIYKTNGYDSPPTDTLNRYPIIIWTTGYDWYYTLSNEDEARLSHYLNEGNGLLLTSQDVLDLRGADDFFRSKLGVLGATLSVTPTLALPSPNNSLKLSPKPSSLKFPFINWGDAIIPAEGIEAFLIDQNLNPIGILNPKNDSRNAFFSFPLETMPETSRSELINRTVFWLSPFGDTQIILPAAISSGGELPIEIQLQRRIPAQAPDQLIFPLPLYTSIAPDSIQGGWSYQSDQNCLVWQNELAANQIIPLKVVLSISPDIPVSQPLLLNFQFYDEKGILVSEQRSIPINQSVIQFNQDWQPKNAQPGDTVAFTLTLTNSGVITENTFLTETLKDGFELISDTLGYQKGSTTLFSQGFNWDILLSPNEASTLTYQAKVTQPQPGGILYSRSDWRSSSNNWLAYARINLPWLYYFPFMATR